MVEIAVLAGAMAKGPGRHSVCGHHASCGTIARLRHYAFAVTLVGLVVAIAVVQTWHIGHHTRAPTKTAPSRFRHRGHTTSVNSCATTLHFPVFAAITTTSRKSVTRRLKPSPSAKSRERRMGCPAFSAHCSLDLLILRTHLADDGEVVSERDGEWSLNCQKDREVEALLGQPGQWCRVQQDQVEREG